MSEAAPRQPLIWSCIALCLLWLAATIMQTSPPMSLDTVRAVALPIILTVLIVAYAARTGHHGLGARLEAANDGIAALETRLRALDGVLADCVGRTAAMVELAGSSGQGLGASVASLAGATAGLARTGEEAGQAAASLLASIPDLAQQVEALEVSVARVAGDTAKQLLAIDTLLARVAVRGRDAAAQAEAAAAVIGGQLVRIDEQSRETTSALAKRAYALDAAIDGVLARAVATVDTVGEIIAARMSEVDAGVTRARGSAEEIIGLLGVAIERQVELMIVGARELGAIYADYDALSATIVRNVELLPGRLIELETPFAASAGAAAALGQQLQMLRRVADEVGIGLAGQLPATVAGLRQVDAGAAALVQRVEGLRETLLASGEVARSVRDTVGRAHVEGIALVALTGQVASIQSAIDGLGAPLGAARGLAGDIEDRLAHATGTLTILSEDAGQLSSNVVGLHAGIVTAEAGSQRVGEQVDTLHVSIASADRKVEEIEVRIDVRARDTLSARSTRLIEQLGAASVDVAKLLAVDAGEDAWVAYLAGDRSRFARRTVRIIDGTASRRIARHYRHDAAFRDEASRYLDLFETLTRRIVDDPDGQALLATIVSSDFGKLYVAIARATGRLAKASG